VALTVVSFIVFPPNVAIHFDKNGNPNSWAPKETNAIIFFATELTLFVIFIIIPSLVFKFPARLISLPNKDYWLKEENKPKVRTKFAILMWEFGIGLFTFLFFVEFLVLDANLTKPVRLNEKLFLSVFITYMVYTVYWCVKILRSFRIPKDAETTA
jgi:uncharacterized membrane protein